MELLESNSSSKVKGEGLLSGFRMVVCELISRDIYLVGESIRVAPRERDFEHKIPVR